MYGITDSRGNMILCRGRESGTVVMKYWDRIGFPVMRESGYEIDQLLQDFMVASGSYDAKVFKFTEEQVEDLLIRKLRGG